MTAVRSLRVSPSSSAAASRYAGCARNARAPALVGAVHLGLQNDGRLVSDYNWIMDVQVPDRDAAERLLGGLHYARAMEAVAAATKYEWTARMSHIMRGPGSPDHIGRTCAGHRSSRKRNGPSKSPRPLRVHCTRLRQHPLGLG
jgi:hypothetical protein